MLPAAEHQNSGEELNAIYASPFLMAVLTEKNRLFQCTPIISRSPRTIPRLRQLTLESGESLKVTQFPQFIKNCQFLGIHSLNFNRNSNRALIF